MTPLSEPSPRRSNQDQDERDCRQPSEGADGFDCGFYCEPNPHVDGFLHYQERDGVNDPYTYEPASFDARSVSGLLWEMLDALANRLTTRDGSG